jgi:predicted nucleic acid-binding Zn ribbon protein
MKNLFLAGLQISLHSNGGSLGLPYRRAQYRGKPNHQRQPQAQNAFLRAGTLSLANRNTQGIVSHLDMATYIYETVPDSPDLPIRRFEVKQSMKDSALTHDPETGQKVRRIISGGIGVLTTGARTQGNRPAPSSGCGSGRCGCC